MTQEEADMGKKKDSDPDSKEYGELSPLPGRPVLACFAPGEPLPDRIHFCSCCFGSNADLESERVQMFWNMLIYLPALSR